MDALRKQANKLREQVAKQQQVVKKQFVVSGFQRSDSVVTDDIELQRHLQLEKLYKSTRSGRDLQKEMVQTLESLATMEVRRNEIGTKLAEECAKFAPEFSENKVFSNAISLYGDSCANVVREQEELNKLLSSEILEPLRAMSAGAPLEDARHLAQRYSRMRHDAELQATEIMKRQARVREAASTENVVRLQNAEAKMQELKANMAVLGKEAQAALAAVEAQQQRLTLQRIIVLLDAEKNYHQRVAVLLDETQAEITSDKQRRDSAPPLLLESSSKVLYFWAEVVHPFLAESEKELSLDIGDYVVVRQVASSGWSEGECRGRSGWFPTAYVERREGNPARRTSTEVY